MSMLTRYNEKIAAGEIDDDALQRELIEHFQRVSNSLQKNRRSWFSRRAPEIQTGIYLYGPVGAGKTFLMDLFYETVAEQKKTRTHLHQFMQEIDAQLRRLQGQANPLQKIAAAIAKDTRLLCFDEFVVLDIATAMILAELLRYLLEYGVVLVATSNTKPDNLYLDGLQRVRFLPTIALIKSHCFVLSLEEKRDYRLGRARFGDAYFHPQDQTVVNKLEDLFLELAGDMVSASDVLVQGRRIDCVKQGETAVWFDFNVLCNLPRSQLDYLEIASRFNTVFLSDIPQLSEHNTVNALLLIHLIDVLYDKGVRVVMSAAVAIDAIYQGGEMAVAFRRTCSRLHEMQSIDYLERWQRRYA